MKTGSCITIEQSHTEKTGVITEPGEYQAVLSTSEKYIKGEMTGDARVFTFRFQVIQHGMAPGPMVNQKLLDDYNRSAASDCKPVYYGLTYSSAGKGNVTLAFATREAAVEYAYNYEKGTVEKQNNGGYRYTGSFIVDQKSKFDSAWDLTDAVNYFAEAAVHKHYFDISDEFTYLSMAPEDLEKYPNLRQLELPRSITLFADGQKEALTNTNTLPLLNDKPYAYIDPETGEEKRGFTSFAFITDQFGGIDSKSVTITDSEGVQHVIRYSESVGKQLLADGCPSGVVTVHEETMYGDSAEYKAVYIAPNENQTELTIGYTQGEESKKAVYNATDHDRDIVADSFSIMELKDLLDPWTLVILKHNQEESFFTVQEGNETVWSDPGTYSITCVNRLGYGYTAQIAVARNIEDISAEQTIQEKTKEPDSTESPDSSSEEQQVRVPPEAATDEPAAESRQTNVNKTEGEKKQTENSNMLYIVFGIAIGLGLISCLIAAAYKRIKLFSKTEGAQKDEDDQHE